MAKLKLLPKLSVGQKVIGKLIDYDSDKCILEQEDENRIQLSMFKVLEEALDDGDYENEIIEISRDAEGYEIYKHDDWPKAKG